MSEKKKNKKILKLYNVALDDIDDKGNINPDAKLLPLFYKFHDISPDDVKETLSSEDWYDDKTNVHGDRHFYIDLPDGRRLYQPVKHRGYSALSYYTKPDRADSLLNNWYYKDTDKDDNYITVHDKDKMSKDLMSRNTDEDSLRYWVNKGYLRNKDIIEERKRGHDDEELNYLTLPVVADIDDEDIIRLHDILNNNYDPGRADLNEVQVRHLRNKVVPQGWFKLLSKDKLDNLIDTEVKDYFTGNLLYPRKFNIAMKNLYGWTPQGRDEFFDLVHSIDMSRAKNWDDVADFLHNEIANRFKLSKGKHQGENIFLFDRSTPDTILEKYFPYDSDITVSDKHYKHIIDDLYDDIQNDKTRSNITNTLMEAKYV